MTEFSKRKSGFCCGMLLTAISFSMPAFAGTITAELTRTEIDITEPVEMQVIIEGSVDDDVEIPVVDGLIFQRAGRSSQMNFINGRVSHTLSLMFVIRAQKTGEFTIPSIKAKIDDKVESALPLTLTVRGQQQNPQPGQPGPQNSQAGKAVVPAESQTVKQTAGVFIERECAKTDPFVGEQVVCFIRVYHRNNINGGQRQGDVGTDFRRFAVEGDTKYVRQVEGKTYGVIELREIIVPLKPGKTTLPAAGLAARIEMPTQRGRRMDQLMDQMRGGVFNMNPFGNEVEVLLESNSVEMNVKPLPDAGKPAGFNGITGEVTVSANLSSSQVKAGETLTITINVSGNALLDTLAEPGLNFPEIGKVYNDKPEYGEKIDPTTGIHSSKTFKIALVPVTPGNHNLGTWELSTFNPVSGEYKTQSVPLGSITVAAGEASTQTPATLAPEEQGQQLVKAIGQDVIGPHRNVNPEYNHTVKPSDLWIYLAGGGIPMGASLLLVGFSFVLGQRTGNESLVRSSKAGRAAEKLAAELRKKLTGSASVSAADVAMILKQFYGDKSARHSSAMTSGDMISLTEKYAPDLLSQCKSLLQTAERLEYATSGASDRSTLTSWLTECEAYVRELDRNWKGK